MSLKKYMYIYYTFEQCNKILLFFREKFLQDEIPKISLEKIFPPLPIQKKNDVINVTSENKANKSL